MDATSGERRHRPLRPGAMKGHSSFEAQVGHDHAERILEDPLEIE